MKAASDGSGIRTKNTCKWSVDWKGITLHIQLEHTFPLFIHILTERLLALTLYTTLELTFPLSVCTLELALIAVFHFQFITQTSTNI